jgi:hypothetical protein
MARQGVHARVAAAPNDTALFASMVDVEVSSASNP